LNETNNTIKERQLIHTLLIAAALTCPELATKFLPKPPYTGVTNQQRLEYPPLGLQGVAWQVEGKQFGIVLVTDPANVEAAKDRDVWGQSAIFIDAGACTVPGEPGGKMYMVVIRPGDRA
jgi:hypothetical protein